MLYWLSIPARRTTAQSRVHSYAMGPTNHRSSERQAVLFLCHHNAVRSQLAEALLRARYGDRLAVSSAGTSPTLVHPPAFRVLEELGVSTLGLRAKHVQRLLGHHFDVVATVCGHDELSCPFVPGDLQMHRVFSDPGTA